MRQHRGKIKVRSLKRRKRYNKLLNNYYILQTKYDSKQDEGSSEAEEMIPPQQPVRNPSTTESTDKSKVQQQPDQRQSRNKKPVDYGKMVNGQGGVSDSMDYNEVSGVNNNLRQQKKSNANPRETKQKCEQIFNLLFSHQGASLFVETLNLNHPKFNELSKDYVNLNKIQLKFRQGQYKNTFEMCSEIRKMGLIVYKMCGDDQIKYNQCRDFLSYFEELYTDIANKPLVESVGSYMSQSQQQMG